MILYYVRQIILCHAFVLSKQYDCDRQQFKMLGASIDEKVDLESDEEISFSLPKPLKVHPLDFESSLGQREVAYSRILRKLKSSPFSSVYDVLIKAKINVLLPFGPLAIVLHYVTRKHVST